ncbi:MAG: DnaJ domain-containing protein [Thaumarchaeota archaeon]|nr:DnaJ domain-containing protein [Nitrososphaerota archaeon]
MEAQEAYRELGLPEGSSQGAIKARYRKLVLELHPDRSRARTEARLRGVTEAYHALRDPSRHAAAAREQRRAQEARNDKRSAPHARGRGMAGGPRGARGPPPEEDWSRFTSEFEADESFWQEYERNFWRDYERRRAGGDGGDGGDGGHAATGDAGGQDAGGQDAGGQDAGGQDAGGHAKQRAAPRQRAVPRMSVSIDESLCIGCCSCETIAPSVFSVDKDRQVNPKSSVTDPLGAAHETIMDAAETCPTKAITVYDMALRRRLCPL